MNINLKDNRITALIKFSSKAYARYRWQIVALIIFGFVGGILEGLGVNALIPLFSFALNQGKGSDFISRMIYQFFDYLHIDFSLYYLLGLISLLFAFKFVVSLFLEYVKIKISADYEEKTRTSVLKKIMLADWPHLMKQKLGNLETIVMVDVPGASSILNQISQGVICGTSLLIYIVIALNISAVITLATLILALLFMMVVKPLAYKIKITAQRRNNIVKEAAHHIGENINGIKTVKTSMVNEEVIKKGEGLFARWSDYSVRASWLKSFSSSFVQPLSIMFVCGLFAYSYNSSNFNLASMVAMVYLIDRTFIYVQQLRRVLNTINEYLPNLRTIVLFEETADLNFEKSEGEDNFSFDNKLEAKNINFSYEPDRPVLNGISFEIKKGEMVGIIGPSGVGKTTLIDLILRLIKPQSGEFLIDGKNIDQINLRQWRKNIGYVSQEIFLMNDTIANNIRFYEDSITDKDIVEAAKMANIYDFIESSPDKLQTNIGDKGLMISAGQRQRIVIARVLARKPKLLILDGATSALDNESEVKIQQVIKDLKGKITVIAIAHRLSTVMDSDKLVVLENGQVAEQGAPHELLKDKESYFFKVYNIKN